MINSFGDKDTEQIWEGKRVKKYSTEKQEIARRKLRMLNNSLVINDLMIPPSNKLEKLKGEMKGLYSIRVNNQWRIVFRWNNGLADEAKLTDYH